MLLHPADLSVAPMMDWTDRHCRYLHRVLTREALLFTEMVTSAAVDKWRPRRGCWAFDPREQAGRPCSLAGQAIRRNWRQRRQSAAAFGHAEITLTVGCPSDRAGSRVASAPA